MSINENTRDALREMGLNAYEIDAYIVLLEGGQMTAMEISQQATVPYSKMYEVLNSLKEKGWIKSSETRPFKYYPVPPLEATRFTKLRLGRQVPELGKHRCRKPPTPLRKTRTRRTTRHADFARSTSCSN